MGLFGGIGGRRAERDARIRDEAYRQAVESGASEEDAVQAGEGAVRSARRRRRLLMSGGGGS
ncbi:hypothetical protein BJY24_005168 [Nocardia transvalensis]|uniref:Uncharacterized protein n=1 Tax=Nocardia transvalensis TaxID=37333 RepID=A0A7W9PHG1_9NOCA|nr:hypothetical protein [Nocardia transvalensis]MBB5916256.1 hypothetical protein [Nocardia transvalensis]